MTKAEIIDVADRLDVMAVRRRYHEAITWHYGTEILNMVERHAEDIARILRHYAVESDQ